MALTVVGAQSNTLFAVVFTVFVIAALVLIVLTIRFVNQRAGVARRRWLDSEAEQTAGTAPDEEGGGEDGGESTGITALVLAGGGTRGAVQIGMLQVLAEHGFVPDRIYGCSVGAVNGTAFAADPSREWVEHMAQVWLGLDRDDVYPQRRLHGPWLYIQQRDSVYPNSGLRRIVEDGVPYARLEDAAIPVEVVATSLTDGREHWFTYGAVVEAVLASAAVPAIFPPVEIDGEHYIDGGVVDNVPIRRAIDAGATQVVVLLCTPPTFTPVQPRRPAEAILNALWISVHARFPRDLTHLPPGVEVIVCAGSDTGARDFDDFSTTEDLIAEGRREAEEIVARYGLGTGVPTPPRRSSSSVPGRAGAREAPGPDDGAAPAPGRQGPAGGANAVTAANVVAAPDNDGVPDGGGPQDVPGPSDGDGTGGRSSGLPRPAVVVATAGQRVLAGARRRPRAAGNRHHPGNGHAPGTTSGTTSGTTAPGSSASSPAPTTPDASGPGVPTGERGPGPGSAPSAPDPGLPAGPD